MNIRTLRPSPTRWLFKSGTAGIALLLSGCVSFSYTANFDVGAEERLQKASEDIMEKSRESERKVLDAPGKVDSRTQQRAARHFAKANEIVLAHTRKVLNAIPFITHDYLDKKKALLAITLQIEARLAVVESQYLYATTFPSGLVVIGEPMAASLDAPDDAYNDALLGILIHELLHLRDGHALEQWASADGRNEWARDKALGALASITALIPLLSVDYDVGYPNTFSTSKQLPELSEYAADLGASSLLEANGFDKNAYVGFLQTVQAQAQPSRSKAKAPFSWLKDRVSCLVDTARPEWSPNYTHITIGSESDEIIQTLSPGASQAPALAARMQKIRFTACAIRKTFPEAPITHQVLQVPGFDITLFSQFY